MKIKVLFLTSWYPTEDKPYAGVFIKNHSQAILDEDVDLMLLHYHVKKSARAIRITIHPIENGLRVELESVFHKLLYRIPFLQFLISFFKLRPLLKNFNPNLIHSNVLYPAGHIGYYWSSLLKVPHLITEHWSLAGNQLRRSFISRKVIKQCAICLPVSKFLEGVILSDLPTVETEVIPNVVDGEFFKPNLEDALNDEMIKFVATASWNKSKRLVKMPGLILDALQELSLKTQKKISLELIGGGNMIQDLKIKARELNIEVQFSGWRDKVYVGEALRNSHYFLHASGMETFSVVIAEALLSGLPVVASNVGAIPELVTDQRGVLAENNLASWVEAIEKALAKPFDRKKIAEEVSSSYSKSTVGDMIRVVYKRVLKLEQ